ncbi:MAG: beta-ketoacyl-[acyl-carrier-protein] synthase family protein [Nitrospirae bacterium]|nr:beta-ketoacyl-[acyl-carrier-protein] synthase family protein [Nitrospirota bacterium]
MSEINNILITGIGVISPIGEGKDEYWGALRTGRSGFREITLFDTSDFNVKIGGEITDFDPLKYIHKRHLRVLDRSTRLLIAAARLSLEDAGLTITDENTYSIGVSAGATFGSLHSISQFDREGLIEGPKYVNPSFFPNTVINSPASQVSIMFKIKGFNTTISTGFCASLDALIYAADFIRLGRADVVLVGGVEELCEETFMGFYRLGLLSGSKGSPPGCKPYDKNRDGLILSEAASVLVLESEEHARKRDAQPYARILSYSNAFCPQKPGMFTSGDGLKKAIIQAIERASIDYEDIGFISSCANGGIELDKMEAETIAEIFGNKIPASSIKSMIGETYSASGAMALSAATGAIHLGFIPATVNTEEPEYPINIIKEGIENVEIHNVLVVSSDPYGNNSAVIIGNI